MCLKRELLIDDGILAACCVLCFCSSTPACVYEIALSCIVYVWSTDCTFFGDVPNTFWVLWVIKASIQSRIPKLFWIFQLSLLPECACVLGDWKNCSVKIHVLLISLPVSKIPHYLLSPYDHVMMLYYAFISWQLQPLIVIMFLIWCLAGIIW